jgi:hypothetical protein
MDTSIIIDSFLNSNSVINFTPGNISDFLFRFLVDIISITILVRLIYYPRHKNQDYVFTYFIFNCLIFIVCYLLNNAKMMFGVAFGLFAIFSIIRYRTVSIPICEMGYFFTCVTLGIINSMTNYQEHFYEILFSNFIAIGLVILLEIFFKNEQQVFRSINYDKLELLRPENRLILMEDLRKRTGLQVTDVKVDRIDLVKNICRLRVYFLSDVDSDNYSVSDQNEDDDD